jgi:polyisoprenyl-phosphate glycosyltransferase
VRHNSLATLKARQTPNMISVVVPVYNEGSTVLNAYQAIVSVVESQISSRKFEIIFVDDGSQDDTFTYLTQIASQSASVRVIKLTSNCGSHIAIRAGFENARGDLACFLASDLQEPPELIPKMLEAMVPPIQIVWAVRNSRDDRRLTILMAKAYYALARLFVSKKMPPSGSSMFMLGANALAAVQLYPEHNLTLEGLFLTMGFQQAWVSYERQSRKVGHSKWTLEKKLKHFADFFVAYSYTPIRLMSYLGVGLATLGFLYAIVILLNKILFADSTQGWSSLMVVVLIMGGIQMVMMGVIGEYVWRTLDESRGRPRYIMETILNDDPPTGVIDEGTGNR